MIMKIVIFIFISANTVNFLRETNLRSWSASLLSLMKFIG